jgi:biopolymer transport protein ExbD
MRRFSQRSALVTLSEINITPLLDLAFVLLIIFVITTPLLEQSIPLNLPHGGTTDNKRLDPHDIRTVEVSPQGLYFLDRQKMTLDQVETTLVKAHNANPNLVIRIRADEMTRTKDFVAVIDRCRKNGLTKMDIRTDPTSARR